MNKNVTKTEVKGFHLWMHNETTHHLGPPSH